MLHKIIFVAHSVAQIGAKTAQNTPFRCSTVYRKLLICFRWGYYLANFKTAAFNHSATPPLGCRRNCRACSLHNPAVCKLILASGIQKRQVFQRHRAPHLR